MKIETWKVNPQYGKENVYWLWDENSNYHDDTSPEAMDRRAQLMQAAPKLLRELQHALADVEGRLYMLPITGKGVSEQKDILSAQIGRYRAVIHEAKHQVSAVADRPSEI